MIINLFLSLPKQENEEFETQTIAVVDCGGGTVLIDTLNDMNLSETRRDQEEEGAHVLYDQIISECTKNEIVINRNDIEKILRDQEEKFYFKPNIHESYDITKEVNRSVQRYTEDLINIVNTTLKGTSDIDVLFFTGGGANLIDKEQVLDRFNRAIFINNSETANLNGFFKYGLATMKSDQVVEE